jgi:phenylacetate-coenzyme A ligase PaaK-like adenylate-forming protein
MLRLPGKDYYAVHNDSFVVNVIDDEGKLARRGRVIITPLFKTDLPLINYEVGDRAVMRTSQGVHFITEVEGRLNDYFRYEDGRVTSFFEVTPVIAHCPDILQIRFIQKSWDLIHVQIVRDQEAKMTEAQLEEYLVTSLNRIFKKPFSFEFEWMQVIPPDPNGKLRMIVCETA